MLETCMSQHIGKKKKFVHFLDDSRATLKILVIVLCSTKLANKKQMHCTKHVYAFESS